MDKVYILESPADIDLLENRTEGYALSSALSLVGVSHEYYLITTENSLKSALELIKSDIMQQKESQSDFQPFLHISAHGNEEGFNLTSEEQVYWDYLIDYLKQLNDILRYVVVTPDRKISKITLCMSSCEGFSATKIFDTKQKSVAQSVIGTLSKIGWGESMIAYISFYNAAIANSQTIERSVRAMNDAICGNDVFIIKPSPELDNIHEY